ncbi:ubiquitin carboxyl-terminal hydrolase 37-like [Brachyhypopomus gauderio]|uniref:ubiquitin carboxyl-terminal hydrolase 37-like n=1 Tax=Brachyhypopomus gauderio TaxID=698409 RepID=UPI0040431591
MGCIYSCMKKKNKEGVNSEVKKKKKQRWWRHIESSSLTQVTDTQSLNVSSSSISCSSSSEGHLTRSNNKLPTEPKNTEGIVPGAADKDVCSVPMDRLPAVVVEGDFRVQNLQHLLPHIVSSERVTESGQGEGQGHAPTVSAGRDTEIQQLGFPNIGNTCYMNATLQCLLSLSCFWSPIRAQCSSWTDPSSCQMLRCFADLQQGRLTSRSSSKKKKLLRALNACISVRCPAFGEDYEQQ